MKHFPVESQRKPLPSPFMLKGKFSLPTEIASFIFQSRQTVVNILNRKDPRLLLVLGPCSIHDIDVALEYAAKVKALSQELKDTFFIVMRAYLEKPRTRLGWKGFLHDPNLDGSNDLLSGLYLSRQLLMELAKLQVPAGTEFLDPSTNDYYGDLITWGCIGARTANSQIHRQIASGMQMPVSFKNTVDGNIEVALHAIQVAAASHTYIGMDEEGKVAMIQTAGNPHGHLVLRGSQQGPNYDPAAIQRTLDAIKLAELSPRLLVDCSHDNCYKNHEKQIPAFESALHQIVEGNPWIRGLMLESNLYGGHQILGHDPKDLRYGVSITDPCLDWESTEKLLRIGRNFLKNS